VFGRFDSKAGTFNLGIPTPRIPKNAKHGTLAKKSSSASDDEDAFGILLFVCMFSKLDTVFPITLKRTPTRFEPFLLPYDIYHQVRLENVLDLCRKPDYSSRFSSGPPPYFPLVKSINVDVPKSDDHQERCRCVPVPGVRGCKKKCVNRMMRVECSKSTCSLGKLCCNRVISRRKWVDCDVKFVSVLYNSWFAQFS
jgi:hypothetical protein